MNTNNTNNNTNNAADEEERSFVVATNSVVGAAADNNRSNKKKLLFAYDDVKNVMIKTKTFALGLPIISQVSILLDRNAKWKKLYAEANEKFDNFEKQDELMLELHRFGKINEIIERFESRKYASGPRSVAAYMNALIESQKMDKYFEHNNKSMKKSTTTTTTTTTTDRKSVV